MTTRRPFIAGNWKMHLDRAAAVDLASALVDRLGVGSADAKAVEVAVCPPAVYLDAVARVVEGTRIGLGGQNMYFENAGAVTGEVSPAMLVDVGCQYVILGHSERRHIFGETDALIAQKTRAALTAGLTPIVCVGETLDEREAGRTADVIRDQFDGSLGGLGADAMLRVVIAYEPVWAIGTGKVATPEEAEAVHVDLRKLMEDRYNHTVAEGVRIQYGGSVKPSNAHELLACPNIDGALVGGASLNADDFVGIIEASS